MVEKHGTWPANARVDVDYSKGKPKIKFEYPKNGDGGKKQAEKQNIYGPHSYIIIIMIFIGFMFIGNLQIKEINYPEECNVTLEKHYINISTYVDVDTKNITTNTYKEWIDGANFSCNNGFYQVYFENKDSRNLEGGFRLKTQKNVFLELIFVLSVVLIGILFAFLGIKYSTKYLIRQKWYQKWLPKHNAEGWLKRKSKKYIKFTPEDVENNMVEIPLFSNVELDYKTDGDFSDKLQRIRIREHQYYKYKKGKVGKKKIELYRWYARFYFKDKPKNGSMEVIFQ